MAAPSAVAKDPWEFIVVRNRSMLNRLASGLPNGQMLADAALGIVVCGNLQHAHDGQLSYLLQDCSAAIENMLLAAQALGLGACWLGVHPRDDRIAHVRALLDLPDAVIPVCVVSIGWPAEAPRPARGIARKRYIMKPGNDLRRYVWEPTKSSAGTTIALRLRTAPPGRCRSTRDVWWRAGHCDRAPCVPQRRSGSGCPASRAWPFPHRPRSASPGLRGRA